MTWRRVAAVIVLLIGIGLGLLTWLAPGGRYRYEREVNIPLSRKPATPEEALPEIWERARNWREDAVLDGLGVWFQDRSTDMDQAIYIYAFASEWQRLWSKWWLNYIVTVDAGKGSIVEEVAIAGGPHNAGQDIGFSSWKVSSTEALQMAEEMGGRQFRERVPDFEVSMRATGWWFVRYTHLDDDGFFYELAINPYTREAKVMENPW